MCTRVEEGGEGWARVADAQGRKERMEWVKGVGGDLQGKEGQRGMNASKMQGKEGEGTTKAKATEEKRPQRQGGRRDLKGEGDAGEGRTESSG